MGTISQRKIDKIQDLKRAGNSITQIQKKVGVSNKTVIKYSRGIKADTLETEPVKPPVVVPTEVTVQAPKLPSEELQKDVHDLLEDTPVEYIPNPEDIVVEVEGIPVNRKAQLTPKNLMMFEWFKERYRWDGDLSDFLNDTMTYFFENKLGAKVEINIKEII